MRSILSALLSLSLVLLPAGAARADADDDIKAKDFYQKGMARFQLEEYDGAIGLWQDGFRLKPAPEFLYNIAQAYRLSHRSEKAMAFYKKYLTMAPKAPNRAEVEKQ